MNHTPGPWVIRTRKNAGGNYMINGSDITDVASVFCPAWGYDAPRSDEEATANARLIAAAPELLEAALAVQASYTKDALTMAHAIKQLNAAIAEARGQA